MNYSQSIKINIGPSDNGMIVPSTHRPTVLYWRLLDFRSNSFFKHFKNHKMTTFTHLTTSLRCILGIKLTLHTAEFLYFHRNKVILFLTSRLCAAQSMFHLFYRCLHIDQNFSACHSSIPKQQTHNHNLKQNWCF